MSRFCRPFLHHASLRQPLRTRLGAAAMILSDGSRRARLVTLVVALALAFGVVILGPASFGLR